MWVVVGRRRFGKTTLLDAVDGALCTCDCTTIEDAKAAFDSYRNETMPVDWMIAVPNIVFVPEDLRNQAYLLVLQPPGWQIHERDTKY